MDPDNDEFKLGPSLKLLYFPVAVNVIYRQLEYDVSKSVTMVPVHKLLVLVSV